MEARSSNRIRADLHDEVVAGCERALPRAIDEVCIASWAHGQFCIGRVAGDVLAADARHGGVDTEQRVDVVVQAEVLQEIETKTEGVRPQCFQAPLTARAAT